jgi:phosphohistidine phosphatase
MTKELMLMRHGEAEPGNSQSGDFNRKLTHFGENQVRRLAEMLKSNTQEVDLLIHSTALRCKLTADLMGKTLKPRKTTASQGIYRAGHLELLGLINEWDIAINKVILVGHNPTISFMVSYLTGEQHILLLPGMMARIHFMDYAWDEVSKDSGVLAEVLQ